MIILIMKKITVDKYDDDNNYNNDGCVDDNFLYVFQVENIHSLDILENYLYLSDGHEKQILKIHRYNYGIPTESLVGNLSRPEQIRIYHKQRQPQSKQMFYNSLTLYSTDTHFDASTTDSF